MSPTHISGFLAQRSHSSTRNREPSFRHPCSWCVLLGTAITYNISSLYDRVPRIGRYLLQAGRRIPYCSPKMAPQVRFELTTFALTERCSKTIELPRNKSIVWFLFIPFANNTYIKKNRYKFLLLTAQRPPLVVRLRYPCIRFCQTDRQVSSLGLFRIISGRGFPYTVPLTYSFKHTNLMFRVRICT